MSIQRIAAVFGITFIVVGCLGFVAGTDHSMMSMESTSLLGLFPVNVLHNVVHIAFGVWGLWAATARGRAIAYALASGGAYLVLAIVGLVTPTLFGMVPIGGYDIALHLLLAALLAGVGVWAAWLAPQQASGANKTKRAA